ncbi:MAG: DUF4832 domain-containing protein [Treponema sp.]|nr:DUF4832 domain-containing protein [Treponema sp.]
MKMQFGPLTKAILLAGMCLVALSTCRVDDLLSVKEFLSPPGLQLGSIVGGFTYTIVDSSPAADSYDLFYIQGDEPVATVKAIGTKIPGVALDGFINDNIEAGALYSVLVRANKANYSGMDSSVMTVTTSFPAFIAPPDLTLVAGDGSITYTFTESVPPADNYTVYWRLGGSYTVVQVKTLGTAIPNAVSGGQITAGLTNGQTYSLVVMANKAGYQPGDSAVRQATPNLVDFTAAPGQPVLIAGAGTLSVSWTASSPAGTYDIYYVAGNTTDVATIKAGTHIQNVTSPHTITGLAGSQQYSVLVIAHLTGYNSSDSNPQTGISDNVSFTAAPGQPVLSAGAGTLGVSWTTSNPAAATYDIYYVSEDTADVATIKAGTLIQNVTSPHTITGLTGSQPYSVLVTANLAGYNSSDSNPRTGTPANVHFNTAPALALVAGNGSIGYSWTASVPPASSYTIYWRDGNRTTVTAVKNGTAIANAISGGSISGLTNSQPYSVVVTANLAGYNSSDSAIVQATPSADAFTVMPGLSLTAGNGSISYTMTASTPPAGSYHLYYRQGNFTAAADIKAGTMITANLAGGTITGVTNGQVYSVVITANQDGFTPGDSPVRQATPNLVNFTTAPGRPGLTAGAGTLAASWTASSPAAGSYDIYYVAGNTTNAATIKAGTHIPNVTSPHTITGLTGGQQYSVLVTANLAGYNPSDSTARTGTPTASAASDGPLVPQLLNYVENAIDIPNADRGFYREVSGNASVVPVSGAGQLNTNFGNATIRSQTIGITINHFYFNLRNYSSNAVLSNTGDWESRPRGTTQAITQAGLDYMRRTFLAVRNTNGVVIPRFLYDNGWHWNDATGRLWANCEPDGMCTVTGHTDKTWVEYHIWQIKPLLQEFEDIIMTVDAGWFGPWGEMHSTTFSRSGNAYYWLLEAMLDAVPASRTIQIHMGAFLPWYNRKYGTNFTFSNMENLPVPQPGTPEARFGFFNDSYCATADDWGSLSEGSGGSGAAGGTFNRNKVINWIRRQNNFYGGESQGDDMATSTVSFNYGRFPFVAWESNLAQTSYLNAGYQAARLNAWGDFIYNDANVTIQLSNSHPTANLRAPFDPVYDGRRGIEFMRDRLGFRLVLRDANASEYVMPSGTLQFEGKVQNVGWGNMVNRKNVYVILKQKTTGSSYIALTTVDARSWRPDMDGRASNTASYRDLNFAVPMSAFGNVPAGDYDIYLRIVEPKETNANGLTGTIRRCIRFAMQNSYWDSALGANLIGSTTVR